MSDLYTIARACEAHLDGGRHAVLATVLAASGSTYRKSGARLLIAEDGAVVGAISGGCVESDLLEHARGVLATGAPRLVHFAPDEDSVFGLALGCRGELDVLLEIVTAELRGGLRRVVQQRHSGGLAAVTSSSTGTRIVEASHCSEVSGELVERIEPIVTLAVFGAGPEAPALAAFGCRLGMEVVVADHRSAFANAARLPHADRIVLGPVESLVGEVGVNARTAAVITMHNANHDRVLLRDLARRGVMYIGLLGPRARREMLVSELVAEGTSEELLANVYGPTGLDIAADTPEEIALAIMAEIVAEVRGGSAGFLRERTTPIHSARAGRVAAIVLAAGSSSRMGTVKQTLAVDGASMVRRAALAAIDGGAHPVFVVIGSNAEFVEREVSDLPVTFVMNEEWSEGIASSVRAGVAAAHREAAAGVLVMLADQPGVDAATVRRIMRCFATTAAPIVAARYAEGGGVPALFGSDMFDALRELRGDEGARSIIRKMPERVALVDVATSDVDTREDLKRS